MVPILKKEKPAKNPASCRPISLLPIGGKITESLVLQRIDRYIEKRGLIPCIQTGFCRVHSTSINLKRMYTHAYTKAVASTHRQQACMTSFDAKKAFDSVYRIGFFHKCMKDGLPGIFIRFYRSWLKNRTLRIRIGETLSRSIRLLLGVPQGSVLAPEVGT